MHEELRPAMEEAARKADSLGESFCIVSGMKNGKKLFRVYPLRGFGLPAGGMLEDVIEPRVERVEQEPPEKNSTNGF
ncbi:MAG: hypothetical protein JXA64_08635 [Candidatus Fermentibacteraceae bacterium]|nr:hypothetical protein [Candidatus Fermentibacteraceae bacterium]MBN2609167.1 hypothetical protein [Candidatus Fermentibacteraceae bacterium]